MHKSSLHASLFLTLFSSIPTLAMQVPFTLLLSHEKPSENQFYIPTFLQQRLTAMPLLIERPPFNFLELLPELQTRTASFVTPHSMRNLSVTCKSLHKNLTFQTPGIWEIVTHSITAISWQKLPELLLKAHFCAEIATEENKKDFYLNIKKKILSCYNLKTAKPYQYETRDKTWLSFKPFSSNHADHFLGACYTGDKNIVHIIHAKNGFISTTDIDNLLHVTIHREKTNIIPLLCEWFTTYLESPLQRYTSHTTYDNPAPGLDWDRFIGNNALCNNRKKAFETIVVYYKKYLNLVDKNGMKYLDFIIHDFANKEVHFHCKKDYQEYGKLVMQHGGRGKEENIKVISQ